METFEVDRSLYEIGENDLKEIWDSDFDSPMQDSFGAESDWTTILDHQPVILNDRMMTDAIQSPHITSEHSYSLVTNDELPDSPLDGSRLDLDQDLESECFPAIPMATATGGHPEIFIKQEPISAPSSPQMASTPSHKLSSSSSSSSSSTTNSQSLLKQPTIILATRPSSQRCLLVPKVNIKVEPLSSGFSLPPTPPSSTSSDSEGSLSPLHSQQPSSPPTVSSLSGINSTSTCRRSNPLGSLGTRSNTSTPLISSQPKGATGVLILTEEEKRTLLAEGYPIPCRLPLTKTEEKSLKKIRRKIKNKISAQESRRKKKEYMDALEKKVDALNSENQDYKKKLDSLESSNKSLLCQLQKLQALLGEIPNRISRNISTQTTSLMVLVLCFTLAFGTWGSMNIHLQSSSSLPRSFHSSLPKPLSNKLTFFHQDSYSTPSRQSRFLLALLDDKDLEEEFSEMTCKELPMLNPDKNLNTVASNTPHSSVFESVDDHMWDYTAKEEIAKLSDITFLESFKENASLNTADDTTLVANFSANSSTVVNASVKQYFSTTA